MRTNTYRNDLNWEQKRWPSRLVVSGISWSDQKWELKCYRLVKGTNEIARLWWSFLHFWMRCSTCPTIWVCLSWLSCWWYTYTYIYIYTYVCIYICIYNIVYVNIGVCICIHIYISCIVRYIVFPDSSFDGWSTLLGNLKMFLSRKIQTWRAMT